MSPFYGPMSLGGYTPQQGANLIRQLFPGAGEITSYPGQGGAGTSALGFSHGGPPLFAGQPPSSLDTLQSSQPNIIPGAGGQPDSITAAISGGTNLPGGVIQSFGGDAGSGGGAAGGGNVSGGVAGGGAYSGGLNLGSFTVGSNLGVAGVQNNPGVVASAIQGYTGLNPTAQAALGTLAGIAVPAISGINAAAAIANSITGTMSNRAAAQALNEGILSGAMAAPASSFSLNQPDMSAVNAGLGIGPGTGMPGLTGPAPAGFTAAPNNSQGVPGQPGLFSAGPRGSGNPAPDANVTEGITGPVGGVPDAGPPGVPGVPGPSVDITTEAGDAAGCFPAGTRVDTEHGPRAIEDIRVGDRLWSRNWTTKQDELAAVQETFSYPRQKLWRVNGVFVTGRHRFAIGDDTWVRVEDMAPTELLKTRTGFEPLYAYGWDESDVAPVFNLAVEGDENFYVVDGFVSYLVHNGSGAK